MPLSQQPFAKASIEEFAAKSRLRLQPWNDRLGCSSLLQRTGILQELRITGGGAASIKSPDFQAVNIVLGNLKSSASGTHHAFGFAKSSHRYLAQVQYLINRRLNLRTSLPRLIHASCATTACPMWLTRGVEQSC